jgi:hypothetical protein
MKPVRSLTLGLIVTATIAAAGSLSRLASANAEGGRFAASLNRTTASAAARATDLRGGIHARISVKGAAKKKAVAYAPVILTSLERDAQIRLRTDAGGRFRVALRPGLYHVSTRRHGCADQVALVTLGAPTPLNLTCSK